ncbi:MULTISPECIES: hypothetical protein [unclassified Streptomyces]|uniref:hypothetical protein n=1 Tax=unclassified Streptomyces TaxID=2593676 RepID=UPI00081F0657|nr:MULTISPECIES: hypothetical protein [unclassified Streptomyces]MYZ33826.1 hypothetical protein [Streptomyces sp. SID4917]SCF62037.1 hypothetical protein GA0115259_1002319 [Streptomyces sp. MnatMP-M17]
MREISRRGLLGAGIAGIGAATATGIAGCGSTGSTGSTGSNGSTGSSGPRGSSNSTTSGSTVGGKPTPSARPTGRDVRLIGDGSTADTGKQPHQPPAPVPLEPGETPPQFVIFSWDGAGEVGNGLFPRFLELAENHGAAMTFFLSGIYLLPESKKTLYRPPNNPVGASDIGYLTDAHIKDTLRNVRQAWLDGHEIGTHFNGHFCGGSGSVGNWTPQQWRSEIDQAVSFVTQWRTNSGWTDLDPLPFDYRKELIGGRTPCLLGQDRLLPTAKKLGWRYDASSPGGTQIWPDKTHGIWNLPLQGVPFPGHSFEVLSMDYNMLANQSVNSTRGSTSRYPGWRRQATGAYLGGFRRAYETNRAPFFIGNHFEQWNGGIYMDAVEEALKRMAGKKDVRLVSFRQFTDWLDVQDPAVLAKLRTLEVGQSPAGGWNAFFKAA